MRSSRKRKIRKGRNRRRRMLYMLKRGGQYRHGA
jgi:hypothetical protein